MSTSPILKIIFLIESMQSRGGMERVTATVASGLARRGLEVQILTLRGHESAFPLAPEVHLSTLGLPPGTLRMRAQTWPLIWALRRRFRADRPDVLIVVDTFLCAFAFPAALGLRVQGVAWEHFHFYTDLGMRSRRFGRWAAAFLGRHVVTLTQQDARQWARAFPAALARIRTITNPLPFVPPLSNPYNPASRTVLAVGRLDDQKGFDLLLSAWAKVEPECPEWSLKILGSGSQEQALRQQAARLGLQRWTLEGATSQIEQEYRAAGAYALSSRHEGLPMVLMESQAYGVPAVAFDCPTGPADLLGPGGGLLVKAGNVKAFAATLRRVLSDPELRQDMSQRAFENSARYEASRILDQWSAFLEAFRPKPSPILGQQSQSTSVSPYNLIVKPDSNMSKVE